MTQYIWHIDIFLAAIVSSASLFFTGLVTIPIIIGVASKGRIRLNFKEAAIASFLFFVGRVLQTYIWSVVILR